LKRCKQIYNEVKAFEKLTFLFPDWHIETLLLQGSRSYEITQKAREWKANLVVVGSQGKTKNKLIHLGSVSQKIANEVECSVRIVRGYIWKNSSPSRILIGLDCTKGSMLAVEEVAQRMWIMGSEVRLVAALDSPEQNTKRFDFFRRKSVRRKQKASREFSFCNAAGINLATKFLSGFIDILIQNLSLYSQKK
jgi:Universal stress protein family